MSATERLTPKFKLWLNGRHVEGVFGDGKWRLLEHIEAQESLRAASAALHISYRKAWGDLKKAQTALGIVLIEQQRGGRRGGRTVLTAQGKRWLDAYRRCRRDIETAVETAFARFFDEVG